MKYCGNCSHAKGYHFSNGCTYYLKSLGVLCPCGKFIDEVPEFNEEAQK